MPDWNIQKGVAITDATPTGVAGGYLNTNFEALRDEAPFNSAAAPTATDDSTAGFFAGSHWFDTTTQTMWVCTDATATAAVWRSLYRRESGAIVLAPDSDGSVQVDNLQLGGNTLSATDTNGDLILAPNGNGALQADSGGDLRGKHAIDFQKLRSVATEVASGNYSTIGGGFNNTASGNGSIICGGDTNEASGTRSFVGGGSNNVASGVRATVCGGASSTASGINSIIAGGSANTASEQNSAVAGGFSNIASGAYSFVGAGRKNTSSGKYAVSMGARAVADHFGQSAQGAGHFASPGDAQSSVLVARRETTNATATELTLDGAAPSAQGRITLADQNCWLFKIHVVARRTDADNEGAAFEFTGCIDRNGATTALIGSVTKNVIARDVVAWDANVTADDTNESLKIEVTGEASKTIRWVARVQLVEVSG